MRRPSLLPVWDPCTRAAVETGLAEVVESPELRALLLRERTDLVPRFNGYHEYLHRLPRRVRRSLERQWKRSLAAIALLLALGQLPALAATITVGGSCTLVDAITAANTDTATGGCPAGCGADTIVLPAASTQSLTVEADFTLGPTGLPVISTAITLEGHGSTITRASGAPDFRIFAVYGGNLTLQETTVSGGVAPQGDIQPYSGGGIAKYGGTLTLTNSTVSGNSAAGAGGGLQNYNGPATLTNSTVSGNSAGANGGGLSTLNGNLTLTHGTVSGNSASDAGGGVFSFDSNVRLIRTLVSGNTASGGPEILQDQGTVTANERNLFGHSGNTGVTGFSPGATDLVPGNALSAILNPTLGNNGGATLTHALPAGSPAIDAVDTIDCPPPATDQRGVTRPQEAACDIGAFEFTASSSLPSPPPSLSPVPTVCGGMAATCVGTAGNDLLVGTAAPDIITGLGGNDVLRGLGGDDVMCGGPGNDVIQGGAGRDRLLGEAGRDNLRGAAGRDVLEGGRGNDKLNGGGGADTCKGGVGRDGARGCERVRGVP